MTHSISPALVTLRGARRLPRLPLLLLCAAYLLPGLFGRDPWRGADLAAFGQMLAISEGRSPWLAPTLGGVPGDPAVLAHVWGAGAIALLGPLLGAPLAARLAFALLLAGALWFTWWCTYHLALTDAAQPLPFAFGGEAEPVDYARAIADAAVLALIATLGLLQLGHETTPELMQLAAVALFAYALASAPFRRTAPSLAVLVALPVLAGSGAPTLALMMGLAGAVVCRQSSYPGMKPYARVVLLATALAALLAYALDLWHWRATWPNADDLRAWPQQWAWFLWPVWPLVLWTIWRWRGYFGHRHLAVPLVVVLPALAAHLAMAGSDRALMLALPGMAALAAFALPTLQRSASAAIDWFSMFFFTVGAIAVWVIWSSMHLGVPAKPAANILRLAPGFTPMFSALALSAAVLASLAWLWLVRWRTGRHREALWKSLVLPAGGVALCWLLVMTLLLPPLDYARSARPLVQRLAAHVERGSCLAAPGASRSLVAALEALGGWRVDARPIVGLGAGLGAGAAAGAHGGALPAAGADRGSGIDAPAEAPSAARALAAWPTGSCQRLLLVSRNRVPAAAPEGWIRVADVTRPTDRDEITSLFRRPVATAAAPAPQAP